jgi:hypothetical protein
MSVLLDYVIQGIEVATNPMQPKMVIVYKDIPFLNDTLYSINLIFISD